MLPQGISDPHPPAPWLQGLSLPLLLPLKSRAPYQISVSLLSAASVCPPPPVAPSSLKLLFPSPTRSLQRCWFLLLFKKAFLLARAVRGCLLGLQSLPVGCGCGWVWG